MTRRHAYGEEKPSKRSTKEGTQRAVAILKHRRVQGCACQSSEPKKFILQKAGHVRGVPSAGRTWNINSNSGHRRSISWY